MKTIIVMGTMLVAGLFAFSSQVNAGVEVSKDKKQYTLDIPYDAVVLEDKRVSEIYELAGQLAYKHRSNIRLECESRSICDQIQNAVQRSAYFASKKGAAGKAWTPKMQVQFTGKYRITISH